ncbi:MAG: hypothetical protein HYV63_06120 [Candidatus Schekmanbacteria bacterium]|nr:hypothetical protein [Candidatus Schekmanbacteria bacterium]
MLREANPRLKHVSSSAATALAAGVMGGAGMLACSTTAAAAPVTAISGHAYLSGAAEHGGIAVSLAQVHVGFSGPALAALLIALAVVVAMAWRRGACRPARYAIAGAITLAIAGGGASLGCGCARRSPRGGDRRKRKLFVRCPRGGDGVRAGELRAALPPRRVLGGAPVRGGRRG